MMNKTLNLQGFQGYLQGYLQGLSTVFIGVCRACRAFIRAHARYIQIYIPITYIVSYTRKSPLQVLQALQMRLLVRLSRLQGCIVTPATPANTLLTTLI